jgi:hypothetical protein
MKRASGLEAAGTGLAVQNAAVAPPNLLDSRRACAGPGGPAPRSLVTHSDVEVGEASGELPSARRWNGRGRTGGKSSLTIARMPARFFVVDEVRGRSRLRAARRWGPSGATGAEPPRRGAGRRFLGAGEGRADHSRRGRASRSHRPAMTQPGPRCSTRDHGGHPLAPGGSFLRIPGLRSGLCFLLYCFFAALAPGGEALRVAQPKIKIRLQHRRRPRRPSSYGSDYGRAAGRKISRFCRTRASPSFMRSTRPWAIPGAAFISSVVDVARVQSGGVPCAAAVGAVPPPQVFMLWSTLQADGPLSHISSGLSVQGQ